MGPKTVQPPQGKTPYIKPVEWGGGGRAQWPSKPTTTTSSKSPGSVVEQSPTKHGQKPTDGRGGTRDDQEDEQFLPRPPPRGNGGGGDGGDGNGGGGDDDDDESDDDEDEEDKNTETVTESENGERQNAPGRGGGGGDEPSSNPGSGNVGPRRKRGHRGQRG